MMRKEPSKLALPKSKPIERPQVDRSLAALPPIERAAEVLRYSILKAEHWLSPRGHLRNWARLNILAALFIGIPALFIVPVVTYLLGQFATWMVFLAQAAKNLVLIIGCAIASGAMISAAVMFVRSRMRKRQG